MRELTPELRRLLVQLGFAAAHHRLRGELPAFIGAVPLLIDDEGDRALLLARLLMESGDLAAARACLAGRDDPHAMLLAQLLSTRRDTAPRLVPAPGTVN